MFSLSIASPSSLKIPPKTTATLTKSSFNGIRLPTPYKASFRSPSSSVVMMAKREEELKEIRARTTEELNEEIIDLKGELLMLRLQKSVRNEFKSSEFGRMRKRVLYCLCCFIYFFLFSFFPFRVGFGFKKMNERRRKQNFESKIFLGKGKIETSPEILLNCIIRLGS